MSFINTSKKDGLGILEFDKSVQFLTVEILDEFKLGFRELAKDNDVKIIIAFAPNALYGMSIPFIYETMKSGNRDDTEVFLQSVHDFIVEMRACLKPTLGVSLGSHLLGGGLEVLRACKYLAVSENTQLGLVEENLGFPPGFGGTAFSRIIGVRKTAEMIISAKMYSAPEAFDMGLADFVLTESNTPKNETAVLAKEILGGMVPVKTPPPLLPSEARFTEKELLFFAKGKSRLAVERALWAIGDGATYGSLRGALIEERENFLSVVFKPNAREGVEAFMQKRKPVFTDAIGG